VDGDPDLTAAAQLFKVLGSESRLRLLRLLEEPGRTVGELVEITGLSQPLVSQHLRTLRHADLVTSDRRGKQVVYRVADQHVLHVVSDAFAHVHESEHPENP
jgi:ArsR family transcriptional regulator, zinc-responsive transcriptional repressor